MAQPTFAPILEGDSLTAASATALFADTVTQSTNIQAANLRDEGIDRRNIPSGIIVTMHEMKTIDNSNAVSYGDATATVDATNWVAVAHSGASLRVNNGGAGWSYDPTTQIAVVRASVQIRRLYYQNRHGFQLWKSIGGVASVLTYTLRYIEFTGSAGRPWETTELFISTLLWENGNYDWVELRTRADGGTFNNASRYYYLSEGEISIEMRSR